MKVASLILNKQFSLETEARIVTLRKEYTGAIDELKSLAVTDEGKRRLGKMEETATHWREMNMRMIQLAKTGKHAEASDIFRGEAETRAAELDAALADYVKFRQ